MAQEIKDEERLEELDRSHIEYQLDSPGKDTTDCCETDNRLKKIPDFVDNTAECQLDSCTSSNTSKEEKIASYF